MTQTARLYGSSLYDLAVEEGLTEQIMTQSSQIRTLFAENPEYLSLLGEPSISREERLKMIDDAFASSAEHYLVNFIKLLCERGLLQEYAGCCDEFMRRYDSDNNIAQANVWTASKLSEEQEKALKAKLEKMTGKSVHMHMHIDRSLIAGVRVEVEGKMLDGTVKSRIEGISRKLSEISI